MNQNNINFYKELAKRLEERYPLSEGLSDFINSLIAENIQLENDNKRLSTFKKAQENSLSLLNDRWSKQYQQLEEETEQLRKKLEYYIPHKPKKD